MAGDYTEWWPSKLFSPKSSVVPYAILILNQPINENALRAILNDAVLVVCADGGANRLFDLSRACNGEFSGSEVDAIVGDLDSLRPEVEADFRRRNAIVERDVDQYSTDFIKCLRWIRKYTKHFNVFTSGEDALPQLDIIALGGLGGRVDQGFSQIHHLYLAQNDPDLLDGHIYLLSEQSLSFVLDPGQNVIHVDRETFNESVGIIPVLGPATITTNGLEWDVTDWKTEFGGQISTSNHIRSDRLDISFEGKTPLFTVELADRLTSSRDR